MFVSILIVLSELTLNWKNFKKIWFLPWPILSFVRIRRRRTIRCAVSGQLSVLFESIVNVQVLEQLVEIGARTMGLFESRRRRRVGWCGSNSHLTATEMWLLRLLQLMMMIIMIHTIDTISGRDYIINTRASLALGKTRSISCSRVSLCCHVDTTRPDVTVIVIIVVDNWRWRSARVGRRRRCCRTILEHFNRILHAHLIRCRRSCWRRVRCRLEYVTQRALVQTTRGRIVQHAQRFWATATATTSTGWSSSSSTTNSVVVVIVKCA